MSKGIKQHKLNIHEEYLNYYENYQKKYGKKSIVLMQVGSFHEAYGTNERGPNLFHLSELLNIVCTRKDKSIDMFESYLKKYKLSINYCNTTAPDICDAANIGIKYIENNLI